MNVHEYTLAAIRDALPRIDHDRDMAFIEIGLGNKDFAFTTAADLGYRAFCVDPLPRAELMAAAETADADVFQVGAGKVDFPGALYLNANDLNGASSIPTYPGVGERIEVQYATLNSLFRSIAHHNPRLAASYMAEVDILTINCLKIDTNGAEVFLLEQLAAMPVKPKMIVIAFNEFILFDHVFLMLIGLGYQRGQCVSHTGALSWTTTGLTEESPPRGVAGNIIAFLE